MDTESERLILHKNRHSPSKCVSLLDMILFPFLYLWYRATSQSKFKTFIGKRKLDEFELKTLLLELSNNDQLEKHYNNISSLERQLRQTQNEFNARLNTHIYNFQVKAKQHGQFVGFTQTDLERMLTAPDLRLKNECIGYQTNIGMEKTVLSFFQQIQNNIVSTKWDIEQWRLQLVVKDHLQNMSDILGGMDGQKLTQLGESCTASLDTFLQSMDQFGEQAKPPLANEELKMTINTTPKAEQQFWTHVLENAKVAKEEKVALMV
jgi:hypothetical protein